MLSIVFKLFFVTSYKFITMATTLTDTIIEARGYENTLTAGNVKYFTKDNWLIEKWFGYYMFCVVIDESKHEPKGEVETLEQLIIKESEN